MAETVSASAIILEVLNKDNYEDWRIRLQTYLEAQDLWDVIEANDEASKERKSEAEIKAWKKKNVTALHTIYISCGIHAFKTIREIKSAKSAWGILKAKFGPLVAATKSSDRSDDKFQYKPLFDAVERNDCKFVVEFLRHHREAGGSTQPVSGFTVLHLAVSFGLEQMVKELLQVMSVEHQEIQDNYYMTALLTAVTLGHTSIAEHMATTNPKILGIPSYDKNNSLLPVGVAFSVGNIDLARSLYSITLPEDLLADKGKTLALSMQAEQYDIALDMLEKCPHLTIFKSILDDDEYDYITILEDKLTAAFPRINIQPMKLATGNICVDVSTSKDSHITRRNITCSGRLKQIASNASKILGFLPATFKTRLGIEHLNKRNLENTCLSKVLGKISDEIKTLDDFKLQAETSISDAIVQAIAKGAVEFVVLLTRADPRLSVLTDKETNRSMLMVAVQYRQEKIVSHFMRMNITKQFVNFSDNYGNTSLHMTGLLPPSSYLNTIPGPALQMQKELQWFQEMENLIENKILKNSRNVKGMTARECFTENHEELRKKGEKWMKETSFSYSLVAALIVTMTFAAGFIIPGATNESMRSLSRENWFLVFLISDAISLLSSTTSVLMFIGILTSRYYEEAFLKSLPTKLILGMSALFFSIATMMLCFCAALYEMLQGQQWILIPIILLASVPVYIFASLQFPLLIQIFKSTYGSGLNIAPKKDKKVSREAHHWDQN